MTVATPLGEVVVRALVSPRQARGSVFAPMVSRHQFAAKARVDALVPAITDPVSGQPASKHVAGARSAVRSRALRFRGPPQQTGRLDADYWAIAPANGGWRAQLAFTDGERTAMCSAICHRSLGKMAGALSYADREAANCVLPPLRWIVRRVAFFLGGRAGRRLAQLGCGSSRADFSERRARFAVVADRPARGLWTRGPPSASASASSKSPPLSPAAASPWT